MRPVYNRSAMGSFTHVRKRDGCVVPFEPAKIADAIGKAFAATGVAFVVNQVNRALAVHGRLWLDAAIGSADECDSLRFSRGEAEAEDA